VKLAAVPTIALAGAIVSVVAGRPALAAPAPARDAPAVTSIRIDEPKLQQLVDRLAPTLLANQKRFDGRSGPVSGFGAGDTYPQIWLRDSATLVDLARYHVPRETLTSWLEEHLAHQKPDGALYDWIAAGPPASFAEWAPKVQGVHGEGARALSADKNTVEADQESSAVATAARVLGFTGNAGWLRKDVAGRTLLQRCDAALSYLLTERRDKASGLVVSGFAADWGDVSPAYGDQRVIYLDDATPRVVGLYTNALAYEAALGLAAMHEIAGDPSRAASWRTEAAALKAAVDRVLWQPKRGFYRMHAPAPGPKFDGHDDDILAMGGHAVALRSGLIDGERARRVLDVLEARRRKLKLDTIAFTLLPPFRAELFKHPAVKEPWTYQNGGQWDWFGGRLVLAEMELGRAYAAHAHLLALAAKAQKSDGLFEWHTRDGQGRGSGRYAGSAGALGAAVLEGLLGVRLRAADAVLSPRLGSIAATVRLVEPGTGSVVDYDYRSGASEMTLAFEIRPARPTVVRLLVPASWRTPRAELDGRTVAGPLETVGADRYARIETDGRAHRVWLRPGRPPQAAPAPRP
jgi:hypothetical protein